MTQLRRIAQAIEDLKTLKILEEEDKFSVNFYTKEKDFHLTFFVKESTGRQVLIKNILMEEFSGNIELIHSYDHMMKFIIQ